MNIPLFEIYNDENDVKLISEEIASGKFWAVGPRVSEFEEKIADFIGTKHAIALNSGTSALHAALLSQGIGKNDEVIVPSFTFISTAPALPAVITTFSLPFQVSVLPGSIVPS